jgi:hypothetical protein
MTPHRIRTPQPRRAASASAMLLAACLCAALLAACGGSSGGAASASPSPTPVPSPQITSGAPPAGAVHAVRRFWTLVGEGKLAEAQQTTVAPGSPLLQWSGDDIVSARFVRVVPHSVSQAPLKDATIVFSVIVWIDPAENPNAWGDPGERQLFENVVRMSDGTWRMWDSGTGP